MLTLAKQDRAALAGADTHALVKKEVEQVFGQKVLTSRDCNRLSAEILRKVGETLNPHTLRRFFGLVQADYPPSVNTLSLLLRYCGFTSIEQFLKLQATAVAELVPVEAESLVSYLSTLFTQTPVREANDEIFLAIVRNTIDYINQRPELADAFHRSIAGTRNGQSYYFEQFVNIDALNGHFGQGLAYYLKEKKTDEAQVFGHALLALNGWLTENDRQLFHHAEEVLRHRADLHIHPFVLGRFYATQLFYAVGRGGDVAKVLKEAVKMHVQVKPQPYNYRLFPCFEYCFAFALLTTGHYEEAQYYVNYGLRHYRDRHQYVDPGYYATLQLIRANALIRLGGQREADRLLGTIHPEQFYVMTRKVDNILYLVAQLLIDRKNPGARERLAELVDETGYVRLLHLLQD